MQDKNVKFIRKNGRVIPIRDKKGAASGPSDKARAYATKMAIRDFETKRRKNYDSAGKKAGRAAALGTFGAAFGGLSGGLFGAATGVTAGAAGTALKKMRPGAAGRLGAKVGIKGAAIGAVAGFASGILAGSSSPPKNSTWKQSDYKKHLKAYQKKNKTGLK